MASTYQTDLTATQLLPDDRLDGLKTSGRVQIVTAVATTTAAWVATHTIDICRLPQGAIVLPHLCHVHSNGLGSTTLTLDVGDGSNADRFADGLDVVTAGGDLFTAPAIPSEMDAPAGLTSAQTMLIGTIATQSGTETAGKLLTFRIAYIHG